MFGQIVDFVEVVKDAQEELQNDETRSQRSCSWDLKPSRKVL